MVKNKRVALVIFLASSLIIAFPFHSWAKSNSHAGNNQNNQNHPPVNNPSGHGSSAPAQPGMPGTGQNPGGGPPPGGGPAPEGPNVGGGPSIESHGPIIGLHEGPIIAPPLPLGPGKIAKPHDGLQTPQPVLPPQQTPQKTARIIDTNSISLGISHKPLPGIASPDHIGHAKIFQHAHSTLADKSRGEGESPIASGIVFLPPQVTHGVVTPPVGNSQVAKEENTPVFYCLLPTVRPDGRSFGGLLSPPPGWQPAQQATTAHVALQGGANYMDPVLRSLPVNHPPHSVCMCDLVVWIKKSWQH